jgi:hypothetical protein
MYILLALSFVTFSTVSYEYLKMVGFHYQLKMALKKQGHDAPAFI